MFISSTKLWREIRYFHVVVVHIIGELGAVSRVGRKGARRKIGSLWSDVFERRTSTGSKLFALLSHDFKQIFGQNVSIRMKTLCNTNTVASRLIKREEGSLPVYSLFSHARFNIRAPRYGAVHIPSTRNRLYIILCSVLSIRHQLTYDIHGQFPCTLIQSGIWKW